VVVPSVYAGAGVQAYDVTQGAVDTVPVVLHSVGLYSTAEAGVAVDVALLPGLALRLNVPVAKFSFGSADHHASSGEPGRDETAAWAGATAELGGAPTAELRAFF
jgi:hypothetical protein